MQLQPGELHGMNNIEKIQFIKSPLRYPGGKSRADQEIYKLKISNN